MSTGPTVAFDFIKLNNRKEFSTVSTGPTYRTLDFGLNLKGVCENSKCKAHGDFVTL